MIKADTISEYLFTQQQRKKIDKQSRELKAREDALEAEMIAALKDNQRVEACGYKLALERFLKPFRPSYKTCAIELTSELRVNEWVEFNDPQEMGERLIVEIKPQKKAA